MLNDFDLKSNQYYFFIDQNCFVHPIIRFWFLVTFGLHDLCLRFAIKNGQDVELVSKMEKNHSTKVTKIPKTKTKIWDE